MLCLRKTPALCFISHLLHLSSKLCIRHITKEGTLNAALDIIKKYKTGKSDWEKEIAIKSGQSGNQLHLLQCSICSDEGRKESLLSTHYVLGALSMSGALSVAF